MRFLISQWFAASAVILILITVAGCSDGRQAVPVSGTITLGGEPLEDIRVYFQPQAASSGTTGKKGPPEAGPGSYGLTDAEGKFTLRFSDTNGEGAVVGTHTVLLSDKRAEGAEEADAGEIEAPPSRLPPSLARQPLTFEVKPDGENQANFELGSKK